MGVVAYFFIFISVCSKRWVCSLCVVYHLTSYVLRLNSRDISNSAHCRLRQLALEVLFMTMRGLLFYDAYSINRLLTPVVRSTRLILSRSQLGIRFIFHSQDGSMGCMRNTGVWGGSSFCSERQELPSRWCGGSRALECLCTFLAWSDSA